MFNQFSYMSKPVLFQAIKFSINTQFCSIWPIDSTLSGATTLGQSGPESHGNEGILCNPPKLHHHWILTIQLQLYWNFTIRLLSVISRTRVGGVFSLWKGPVGVFYNLGQLGKMSFQYIIWSKALNKHKN